VGTLLPVFCRSEPTFIWEGEVMFREMKVSGLVMDPQTNTPILILKDLQERTSLPIWIGLLEATSIATELEKIQFPRPMTHDLIRNCFEQLEVKVERIEVCDLKNNTYYALIYLRDNDRLSTIDARPSDAIAIALRTNAPIFVREDVLARSQKTENGSRPLFDKQNKEKWADILEKLDPEDFSKYKM
jgi:bifunctional DNase/RNase